MSRASVLLITAALLARPAPAVAARARGPLSSAATSGVARAAGAVDPAPPPASAVLYRLPVAGALHVVAPFVAPLTVYGAGHRGVDLATTSGQPVLAAAAGRVTFAGPVAGRGVIVIAHADGVRTEYEPVTPTVHAGQTVAAGQVIGRVHGAHRDCAAGQCLHWGASRDGTYFDPLSLLQALGAVRLLPWPEG